MKYIKKFENSNTQYKVGDIVRVTIKDTISDNTKNFVNSNPGKIISIDNIMRDPYPYSIDFIDNIPEQTYSTFVLKKDEIIRLATPEEIKFFNTKKEASKYNL